MRVLVTGATGYIGGRLIPKLLAEGIEVRVLVRDPERIQGREWAGRVEVHTGDLLELESIRGACDGVDAAYYLVHSMEAGTDFAARDRQAAENFVREAAGVPHTLYLGGLLPAGAEASEHLRSRTEVGEILRAALPVTEFRAGPVIGSGSASFEMIRYLTERVPVMVAPRWILNDVQPIAIRDVLACLISALRKGPSGTFDIGADRMSFRRTMQVYAEVQGFRRFILPVPVLAPKLAALRVGLVTPIPNRLAVPLIRGIVHPVVAHTGRARRLFPEIEPIPYRTAVELALRRTGDGAIPTRWSNALRRPKSPDGVTDREGIIREVRSVHVDTEPSQVYAAVSRLGGDRGWLVWDWAWQARGLLDRLVGGPGLRRGRRDPAELLQGEALDFWRVEAVEPPHRLRLRAEMKVPGAAWLEWTAHPEEGGTRLVQTASFAPRGLAGVLYWYLLYPVHKAIFTDLVNAIARDARQGPGSVQPGST